MRNGSSAPESPLLLRFPFVQHGETKIASRQNFEK
jgi:hypothetical protein